MGRPPDPIAAPGPRFGRSTGYVAAFSCEAGSLKRCEARLEDATTLRGRPVLMLSLLLLLPLGGLEFIVIPAVLWTVGPASWHFPLMVTYVVIVALASATMMRRMRDGSAERRTNLAEQAGWRWAPQMAPHQYRLRLVTF